MKPVPISLRQVAERAGVSDATVSRVLNNANVRIATETRQRITRIAKEMGYQPNRAAQALATGRTQTLAFWAANLRTPYYTELIGYTRQETIKHGYDLMISAAQVAADGSLDTSKLMAWPVDGVLTVDLPRGEIPGLAGSLLWGKPFVNMGGYVHTNADYVRLDFSSQAFTAAQHLIDVGCKRVAYLVPDWFGWYREIDDERLRGYETAMANAGRPTEFILTVDEARSNVAGVLKSYILKNGLPDGLFCFNDDMAIGAYRALRDLGLRIPDDVALVGCNGIEDTEYFDPPITTIVQPVDEMCAVAWTLLEKRIQDPSIPLQQVTLQARFRIRGSSIR
jgi:LacI family transcriptional regulator